MRTNSKFNLALISFCAVALFPSCKKESDVVKKQGVTTSFNSSDALMKDKLVGWYTFNGDALDHSGNNNNVDFNNATPTEGKKGYPNSAYYFDGISSYMTIPNSTSLNPDKITLAAFLKPTGFYQGECHRNTILYKAIDDFTPGKYMLAYDDMAYYNYEGCDEAVQNKFENFFGSYGDGQATAAGARDDSTFIHAGSWYAVVFTYDGTNAKLYINGVLKQSNKVHTSFSPNTVPIYIGKTISDAFPYWFTGVIDEIRIYSRALTEAQVEQLTQVLQKD
jgi:hypothetical protein